MTRSAKIAILLMTIFVFVLSAAWGQDAEEPVDMNRAKSLFRKQGSGGRLTEEEQAYLDRARAVRNEQRAAQTGRKRGALAAGRVSIGIKPLCEMAENESYKTEDGGLYGNGRNSPPEALQAAAEKQLAAIRPLDGQGSPAGDGKIVLLSIGMSNTTQEFSAFKRAIDSDPKKSEHVFLVDGAQAGQSASEWTVNNAERTWSRLDQRLKLAGVTHKQVQALWVKQAELRPLPDEMENARLLQTHLVDILNRAKARFPNLQIAYLSSRTYGGYSERHPEPESFATAFSVRWVIQDQMAGKPELNWKPDSGAVKAPLVLWGPYLWADGTKPRQNDALVWERRDFVDDGTHPGDQGKAKVVQMLTDFFTTDPNAKGWFLRK